MLDAILNQEDIVQESKQRLKLRLLAGIFLGFIAGVYILSAIDRGAFFYFYLFIQNNINLDSADQEWNPFSWNNWFIRFWGCVLSSFIGAFISGLVARKKGNVAGLLSSIPSFLFWLYFFYSQFEGKMELCFAFIALISNTASKIMAIVLAIINLLVGYQGGRLGEESSKAFYNSIDKRKYSIIGLKWYHYLWFPVIGYFILIQGFSASLYVIEKTILVLKLPEYSLKAIIPNILSYLV